MHAYSVDTDERKTIIAGIVIVGLVTSRLASPLLSQLLVPPVFMPVRDLILDVVSPLTISGALYVLYNRVLWRIAIQLKLSSIADFSGLWTGQLSSSFDKHSSAKSFQVIIDQSWTEISICLKAEHSESESYSAAMITKTPGGARLVYHYGNQPKARATKTMHAHLGIASLRLCTDGYIEGEYFTGRDRQTQGTIVLQRITTAHIPKAMKSTNNDLEDG